MTNWRLGIAILGVALASVPLHAAEPAPVPTQILTAKKAFISNVGVDGASWTLLDWAGDAIDEPYNRLYAAMKSWGRFDLVGAPSDAELVFEVRLIGGGVELTILDARTHFTLWALAEPMKPTAKKATWNKNFDQALADLVNDMKGLAGGASK